MLATRPRSAAPLLAVLAALAVGGATQGATYTITTLEEDDTPNGNCTLREALRAASTDSTHDSCVGDVGPDTIVLAAVGTYELDDGNISSAARQLTVRGDGDHPQDAYVVDLGGVQRFFGVLFGSQLTLENLTLTNGFAAPRGGTVRAQDSDLTMKRVTISGSRSAEGGAVAFEAQETQRLEVVGVTFSANRAVADQARGGGLYVKLNDGGDVRIVTSRFLDNRLEATTGSFSRAGGGLYVDVLGAVAVEVRHLELARNQIDAPSFASGAGAWIRVGSTGPLELSDARFDANEHVVAAPTNGPAGLNLDIAASSATVRRLRLLGNLGGTGKEQAAIQVRESTPGVVSDVLAGNGNGIGVFLATSSGTSCSLVAGNLTVAGHPGSGLRLAQSGCPLRVESSLLFGNGTSSGSDLEVFFGSPEISPETLAGVDPLFVDAANGDFQLADGSPAIDAGDASFASVGAFDAAHGARVIGLDVDLGALERPALFAEGFERGDLFAWAANGPE
jgi:hypothetical protein